MRTWIKTDTRKLNDIRFASLSAEAERTYGRLYLLAGQLDVNGLFLENGKRLTDEEIAYRIRLNVEDVREAIKELTDPKVRLIYVNGKGPQITDWKHEQIELKTEREKNAERQRKSRAGKAASRDMSQSERDVSQSSRDVTPNIRQQQTTTEDIVVVVVTSVLDHWKSLIRETTEHDRREITKLAESGIPADVLLNAVEITADQGKSTIAYFRGVVKNLMDGTIKPTKRREVGAKKKLDGKHTKL